MGDDGPLFPLRSGTWDFYPRPPYGGRLVLGAADGQAVAFLSTSPVWGTTRLWNPSTPPATISIHVPRMGDDTRSVIMMKSKRNFYPRPPYGGRLRLRWFSPLRANFYPRPPYGGRRGNAYILDCPLRFLSTSPVWGTTLEWVSSFDAETHFYPRPPYGGRHCDAVGIVTISEISIHVPRMGDDRKTGWRKLGRINFYPRPPYGGRPCRDDYAPGDVIISIHVPRMGDDAF